MIVRNSRLARILRVNGIVLYPFVFLAPKDPDVYLLNHELIHLAQIKRVGVLRFYVTYLREYLRFRKQRMGHDEAYRSISFEREAYENDRNLDYLA